MRWLDGFMSQKLYAFTLNNGKYRFLVAGGEGGVRVFVKGENGNECYLRLLMVSISKW